MLDWQQLGRQSNEELARFDIAEVHLACATGLPGWEKVDYNGCVKKLNELTPWVRDSTAHCLRKHGRGDCETENRQRMMCLATCLWQGAGIRYNPAKISEDTSWDFEDAWIHGALFGPGGTCATLPIIYTSIGRRLGYPLRLVQAYSGPRWSHLFCRWDDPAGERFNFEVNYTGASFPEDGHYRQHGQSLNDERTGGFLKSMTPREELSGFFAERAACFFRLRNVRWYVDALAWSVGLAPANVHRAAALREMCEAWDKDLRAWSPPGFPVMVLQIIERRYPAGLPEVQEADILRLGLKEGLLRDEKANARWWEPIRRMNPGVMPPKVVNIESRAGKLEYSYRY